jgi:predicted MFS family arabinose efflux permease
MSGPTNESRSWHVVALLFAAFTLCYVDRQSAFAIFPVLKRQLGFSDVQLGLVGSLFGWSYALSMPLAGRLADIIRRDRLVVTSLVLWSFAALGTARSGSPVAFLAWRVVMGLTESLYFPAAIAIIGVLHAGVTRSRALGVHQSAQMVGIVAGGWYGGWTAEHIGWRNGFSILFLLGIAYALVLFKGLGRVPVAKETTRPGWRRSLRELRQSPLYIVLAAAFFCFCAVIWIVYAWLPDVLFERFGLSLTRSGLDATLYIQASCGAGVLFGGWLADRLIFRIRAARLSVVACGILLSAPFFVLTFRASSIGIFRVYAVAFGFLAGLAMANIFAAAYDLVRDQNYGFAAGVLNMTGGISGGAAMLLVGAYKDVLGTNRLVMWSAAAAMLSAIVLLAFTRSRLTSRVPSPVLS